MPTKSDFIEAMAKHLAPSASDLRLLDVGGVASEILLDLRPDLDIELASLRLQDWDYLANSRDSVVAYDTLIKPDFLSHALTVLRPGGRLIVVNPVGNVEKSLVMMLEDAGYTRILVEAAAFGEGVLIRGEKVHYTDDTLKRVGDVANRDGDLLDLENYKGRYVHLLIVQTPNKPVWKLEPDEHIEWHAVAIENEQQTKLLAFSSLPKAVSFMQPAVLDGFIKNVNKVGKFSKQTANSWDFETLLNPTLYNLRHYSVRLVEINPDSAEAPDE